MIQLPIIFQGIRIGKHALDIVKALIATGIFEAGRIILSDDEDEKPENNEPEKIPERKPRREPGKQDDGTIITFAPQIKYRLNSLQNRLLAEDRDMYKLLNKYKHVLTDKEIDNPFNQDSRNFNSELKNLVKQKTEVEIVAIERSEGIKFKRPKSLTSIFNRNY